MILYGPIQERALDEAQRQIKPVVAVNKPPAVNSSRGAYPGTDARRAYMRAYMAKRRA
jgi:hypothetical protein